MKKRINKIYEIRNDILNGEELKYDYEIGVVSVTVLMDDFPWVRIKADGEKEWEYYNGKPLDAVLDELVEFIKCKNIKYAIEDAISDKGCVKEGIDCSVTAFDNGATTTIQYQGDRIVSVIFDNQDIADDEDGIIAKVAEFFANY